MSNTAKHYNLWMGFGNGNGKASWDASRPAALGWYNEITGGTSTISPVIKQQIHRAFVVQIRYKGTLRYEFRRNGLDERFQEYKWWDQPQLQQQTA